MIKGYNIYLIIYLIKPAGLPYLKLTRRPSEMNLKICLQFLINKLNLLYLYSIFSSPSLGLSLFVLFPLSATLERILYAEEHTST